MSFWVYENWTAEHKAVIHTGGCGNCNDGQGCHELRRGSQNGRWLGPFDSFQAANRAADATGRPVRRHRCTSWVPLE